MTDNNPFGSKNRENVLKQLLDNGLVRRITIIEGNYPTDNEQKAFIKRIMDWLHHQPRR